MSQGASGVSAQEHQAASSQLPSMAASVHDSVNTVGTAAISKAIQQAQAQAQAHGMGSQVKLLPFKYHYACTLHQHLHVSRLEGNITSQRTAHACDWLSLAGQT